MTDESDGRATTEREELPQPSQTPVFRASQMARYTRQEMVRNIEKRTARRLICYVATPGALFTRADVSGFADLVHDLAPDEDVDLLINTYGGDTDAAYRVIHLIRKAVPQGSVHAVIPDSAKSAGTLLAIGTDRLIMSDTSELGPIDPLVRVPGTAGADARQPAQAYIAAFEEALTKASSDDPAAVPWAEVLRSFDATSVKTCRQAVNRTRLYAEEVLKGGMFAGKTTGTGSSSWTQVAANLVNRNRWGTHGAVITCDEACEIGLEVDYLPRLDDVWQAYWRLYCLQIVALEAGERLFEGARVSLTVPV